MPIESHKTRGPASDPLSRKGRGRNAFLEIDVLAGLIIVAALTLALAAVLGRQHRAVQKLADARAAAQVAEAVLADLQAGRAPAHVEDRSDPDVSIDVRPAGDADGADASSRTWVEIVVTARGGRASLVGLVPKGDAGGTR